jgi:hypothetical protein
MFLRDRVERLSDRSVILKVDLDWLDAACGVGIFSLDFFDSSCSFDQVSSTKQDGVYIG